MKRESINPIAVLLYSLIGLTLLTFVNCGGGGGGGEGGSATDNFGNIMSKGLTDKTAEAGEEFWTIDRIKKAMENPLDMTIDLPSEKGESIPESPVGTPKYSPPYNPDGANRGFLNNQEGSASAREASSSTCPASEFVTGYFPNYSAYPERTQGMLVVKMGNDEYGVCSGTLIGSKIIMTAAHCVADSGEWYDDWVFVPGFNGSENYAPYGIGYAKQVFIYSGWFDNSYYPADVAFIILKQSLGDKVGWLGIQANKTRNQKWLQVGYPATYPYEWVTLAYNISSYGYDECRAGEPCLIAVGSLLTEGSSGGPWVNSDNYVNGLNSAKPTDCLMTMLSPYFGDKIWNLYQLANTYQ